MPGTEGNPKEDQGLVTRVGSVEIDWPRSIGYFGGLGLAVAFDLIAPPIAIFVAAIPFIQLLKPIGVPQPPRLVAVSRLARVRSASASALRSATPLRTPAVAPETAPPARVAAPRVTSPTARPARSSSRRTGRAPLPSPRTRLTPRLAPRLNPRKPSTSSMCSSSFLLEVSRSRGCRTQAPAPSRCTPHLAQLDVV